MRRLTLISGLLLLLSIAPGAVAQEAELSPACLDYKRSHIVLDGYVDKPVQLSMEQLAALPDQKRQVLAQPRRLALLGLTRVGGSPTWRGRPGRQCQAHN